MASATEEKTIRRKLELVEVFGVCQQLGSVKGNTNYRQYVNKLRRQLIEINEDKQKEVNFWDELRKAPKKKMTLFDALKGKKTYGI